MRKRLYISAGIFLLSPSISIAQTYISPPEFATVDKNGVDLLSGSAIRTVDLGSIGAGEGAMSYSDYWTGGSSSGVHNNLYNLITFSLDQRTEAETASVGFANSSMSFKTTGGPWNLLRGRGHLLEESPNGQVFTLKHSSGEIRTYGYPAGQALGFLVLLTRTLPSGTVFTYQWQSAGGYARPTSVESNHGYKVALLYSSNATPSLSVPGSVEAWSFVSTVQFFNLGVSNSPIFNASRTSTGGVGGTVTTTTVGGQTWVVSGRPSRAQGAPEQAFSVTTPSASTPNLVFTPVYLSGTTSATAGGAVYNYNFVNSAPLYGTGVASTTVTDPGSGVTKVDIVKYASKNSSAAMVTKVTDPLNRVTQYTNISGYLIDSVTRPEGDKDIYAYDSRGNITSVTYKAKVGSGLADRVQSATFPTTCTNGFVTCNKPTSTTDARGAVTNYAYDQTHGGILSVMGPPPTPGSARPLKLTTWQQRYAWILNSGGVLVQASTPVWVVATETSCQTATGSSVATCDPSAQQTVTTYEYGAAQSATTLLVKGVAVSSGGTTLRTCYQYDSAARKIAETTPNANLGVCP